MSKKNNFYLGRVLVVDDTISRHQRFDEIFEDYCPELRLKVDHSFGPHDAIQKLGEAALKGWEYRLLCLDHDLSVLDDGRNLSSWLKENSEACPSAILIHSHNHICARTMEEICSSIRRPDGSYPVVKRIPFAPRN